MSINISDRSHLIALYTNEDIALIYSIIPFFLDGLRKNEICVYGAPQNTIEIIKNIFLNENIELEYYINKKQLLFISEREEFLVNGRFEMEKLLNNHRDKMEKGIAKGFSKTRVSVELSWLIDAIRDDSNTKLEYKRLSYCFFDDATKINAVCHYDKYKLCDYQIVGLVNVHHCLLPYEKESEGHIIRNPYLIEA